MYEKILIVEDDETIIHVLSSILKANEYNPVIAKNGEEALTLAASYVPDLILLDLGLPRIDGTEVLQRLRTWCGKPILVVSARDQENAKVQALDLGADDYITKPFGASELLARIRAALRNSKKSVSKDEIIASSYTVGNFEIEFQKHIVKVNQEIIHLTQIEFKIVEFLARQPGCVLTYDSIMEHVWGPHRPDDNKILRVNMANIRRKIEDNPAEPKYIQTEMGIGYRITDDESLKLFLNKTR